MISVESAVDPPSTHIPSSYVRFFFWEATAAETHRPSHPVTRNRRGLSDWDKLDLITRNVLQGEYVVTEIARAATRPAQRLCTLYEIFDS